MSRSRSNSTIVIAAATTEVAIRTSDVVTTRDHTKIGSRMRYMPFARIRATVTRKFTALTIDETPRVMNVSRNACCPSSARTLNGG